MENNYKAWKPAFFALSVIISAVVGLIGFSLLKKFPSFDDATCQGQHASGCVEWSLLMFGPLYLVFCLLAYALVFLATFAPVSLGLALMLRKGKTDKAAEPDA